MRKYTYNRVTKPTGYLIPGMLLTDCELRNHVKQLRHRRDIPVTEKIKVEKDSVYWFFGARFSA